jgi:hypothetical protein
MFTGFDPVAFPVLRLLRGRIAAYNMHLRGIADTRGCDLVDLWSMRFLREMSAWSPDRLHLTASSHRRVALRAGEVLGVPVADDWRAPLNDTAAAEAGSLTEAVRAPVEVAREARAIWLAARREDAKWAREYFMPWISRRLHGTSSGDGRLPKRPELLPVTP